jgi:AcrR family transcriptional regulator
MTTTLPLALPQATVVQEGERADARRNRERILCAAARLFHEGGGEAVSMDDVAAAAGVGKGTLYRRFGDRSSLIRALIDEPEQSFQEAVIRGAPPLGPGAPPLERLHAFGAGVLRLLERHSWFIRESEGLSTERWQHPVYAFYRMHLGVLLSATLGSGTRTDYLADCLLAPLGADLFLYQRERLGMSLDELIGGWCTLADAVVSSAAGPSPVEAGTLASSSPA